MNTPKRMLLCGLAAAITLTGLTLAHADSASKRQAVLAKYDANQNGELDAAERNAWLDDDRAATRKRFDKNGDGTLDTSERSAMAKGRTAEVFTVVDRNKNGSLESAEVDGSDPFSFPMVRELTKRFDQNRDGVVTRSEMEAKILASLAKHSKKN